MRLWHQELIEKLPRQQLLGQHREVAALRGLGWGKKHATVNYVFTHDMKKLVAYHMLIIKEMFNRGYKVSPEWLNPVYRGKLCKPMNYHNEVIEDIKKLIIENDVVYAEHDKNYLKECLDNLQGKGIYLN
jgi:uncharacterized protein (TIGR02328 family)